MIRVFRFGLGNLGLGVLRFKVWALIIWVCLGVRFSNLGLGLVLCQLGQKAWIRLGFRVCLGFGLGRSRAEDL